MKNEQTSDLMNIDFSVLPGSLMGPRIEDLVAGGMTYDFDSSMIVYPGSGQAFVEIWRNHFDVLEGTVQSQGTRVLVRIDPWSVPTEDALKVWCVAVHDLLDSLTGCSNWRVRVRAGVLLEGRTKSR